VIAPAATETREGTPEPPPAAAPEPPDEPSLRSRLYGSDESGAGNEPPGERQP